MPIQTYADAIAFWNSRINYERIGMPSDQSELKLDRMQKLLHELGQPHRRYKSIHITGTKGKGSTAAMLASVLREAGLRTGLFTSPHLIRIEERVQVNGEPIPEEHLTKIMRRIEAASEVVERSGETPPTFFEIITALGFCHFAEEYCDWAVLEVGLGGRFDATNVCKPEVSIITNVSLDHMEHLGPTEVHIAREKAGIIKPQRPVVTGVTQPDVIEIIREKANSVNSPLYALHHDFEFEHRHGSRKAGEPDQARFMADGQSTPWMNLPLSGAHQAANAALAWKTVELLRPLVPSLSSKIFENGLDKTEHYARFEILCRVPWIILDCAHNVASINATLSQLDEIPVKRRHLLFSVSRDKQYPEMLALMKDQFIQVTFTRSSSPRSVAPEKLAELWKELSPVSAEIEENAILAFRKARKAISATSEELLLVTGSVFLAGELRMESMS